MHDGNCMLKKLKTALVMRVELECLMRLQD